LPVPYLRCVACVTHHRYRLLIACGLFYAVNCCVAGRCLACLPFTTDTLPPATVPGVWVTGLRLRSSPLPLGVTNVVIACQLRSLRLPGSRCRLPLPLNVTYVIHHRCHSATLFCGWCCSADYRSSFVRSLHAVPSCCRYHAFLVAVLPFCSMPTHMPFVMRMRTIPTGWFEFLGSVSVLHRTVLPFISAITTVTCAVMGAVLVVLPLGDSSIYLNLYLQVTFSRYRSCYMPIRYRLVLQIPPFCPVDFRWLPAFPVPFCR